MRIVREWKEVLNQYPDDAEVVLLSDFGTRTEILSVYDNMGHNPPLAPYIQPTKKFVFIDVQDQVE